MTSKMLRDDNNIAHDGGNDGTWSCLPCGAHVVRARLSPPPSPSQRRRIRSRCQVRARVITPVRTMTMSAQSAKRCAQSPSPHVSRISLSGGGGPSAHAPTSRPGSNMDVMYAVCAAAAMRPVQRLRKHPSAALRNIAGSPLARALAKWRTKWYASSSHRPVVSMRAGMNRQRLACTTSL